MEGEEHPKDRNRPQPNANSQPGQKNPAYTFHRPISVGSRAHERQNNPNAFANQGSGDLAGRNATQATDTQASMAGYNDRRAKAQTQKAEKLATFEQKELDDKLRKAEQELEYDTQSLQVKPVKDESEPSGELVVSHSHAAPLPKRPVQNNGNKLSMFSGEKPIFDYVPEAAPTKEAIPTEMPAPSNPVGFKVTTTPPVFTHDVQVTEPTPTQNIAQKTEAPQAQESDIYETPLESAERNMRPNFFPSLFRNTRKSLAKDRGAGGSLRDAEKNASNQDSSYGLDAQTGENEINSDYINNVGKSNEDDNKKRVKSGFLKKKGPLATIIISLLFGGGGMYMTQSALPFTVLDKLNDNFDSQNVSVNRRSNVFTRLMAKNAKNLDAGSGAVKKNLFGKSKFKVSSRMKKRMRKHNLNIITDKNNPNVGKLEFTDEKGNKKIFTPEEFEGAYKSNPEVRKAYDAAAHPWKTSVSNFLDKGFKKIMNKFGIKKRPLDGYDPSNDPTGEKARKQLAEQVEDTFDEGANNKKASGGENDDEGMLKDEADNDPNNANKTEAEKGESKAAAISGKLSKSLKKAFQITQVVCIVPTIVTGATLIAQAYQIYQVVKIAMLFMSGVDQARAGDAASSPINVLGRSMVEQSSERRFTSTFSAESDYEESEHDDDYGYYEYTTDEEFDSHETTPHSAIQSEGMSKLFTGDPIDDADESISSFNPKNTLKGKFQEIEDNIEDNLGVLGDVLDDWDTTTFLTDVALDPGTFYACQVARMSLAYLMLGFDVLALIASIGAAAKGFSAGATAGAGICAGTVVLAGAAPICGAVGGIIGGIVGFFTGQSTKKAIKEVIKMAVSWIGSLVASWAASHIAGFLATMLKRKAVTAFFGEDFGNGLMSGSHVIMGDNHRAGGGLLADKEGYMAMLIQQDAVNAEEAKSDRLARSPFDITSQNTFAGQLAATLTPVMLQSDSLLDAVGKFGVTVRNSTSAFLPSASAYNAAKQADDAAAYTKENCENLYAINVVGDEFCNPYIVTDFDTMFTDTEEEEDVENADNSPYKVMQKVGQENFSEIIDETENPKIKEDSDLADYILYCSERESSFGYADENIASRYDTQKSDVWGLIDIVDDYRDAQSGNAIIDHFGWIDGSNCVIHEDLDYENAIDYDKVKYFSRYMEDQRLAESMGVVEESAVSIFLDEYYEKNPKDMSTKSVIARMAGMSEETYDSIMAGIEVLDFIAHYDPTDYYPTPAVHPEKPVYTIEDQRLIEEGDVLAVIYVYDSTFYYQRNFAVA